MPEKIKENLALTGANKNKPRKKYLEDVVLLRLSLIFLLIWNHALAPYSGNWESIDGISEVPAYSIMGKAVYYMRTQALVFISGFLLGYTAKRKSDALEFKSCVIKKVKRLILPSVIFSALYFALFYHSSGSLPTDAYNIINGCGHMWFLPMLFWCFVLVWAGEKLRVKPVLILCAAILAAILPWPDLPLRINNTLRYFLYFYIGFGLQRGYFPILNPNKRIFPILGCLAIYGGTFALYEIFTPEFISSARLNGGGISLIDKALMLSTRGAMATVLSVSGILSAFWSAHFFVIGKYKLPAWMITLSTYCYGVYICQQFILVWLYYHTSLPATAGTAALPWIALIITLLASLFITHSLLKTRFGRFLLG